MLERLIAITSTGTKATLGHVQRDAVGSLRRSLRSGKSDPSVFGHFQRGTAMSAVPESRATNSFDE
ncbi:hypothetical protein ACVWWN_003988 [Mycobacterium sp. URHB0021]